MFDEDQESELQDGALLSDEDAESLDDLLSGFSDEKLEEVEDPFAALDEIDEDDFFTRLQSEGDEFDDELFEEQRPEPARAAADEALPPLPDTPVPEWLSTLGIESEEIVERRDEAEADIDEDAEPLAALAGTGPKGMALGMTAQQRMVLAVFLFLDVAVLGFLLLYALDVIRF